MMAVETAITPSRGHENRIRLNLLCVVLPQHPCGALIVWADNMQRIYQAEVISHLFHPDYLLGLCAKDGSYRPYNPIDAHSPPPIRAGYKPNGGFFASERSNRRNR